MTPLEELQAAHKRLSELHEDSAKGEWGHWPEGGWVEVYAKQPDASREPVVQGVRPLSGWQGPIYQNNYEPTADLIVTLHRTIDAQLEFLRIAQFLFEWDTGAGPMSAELAIALDLARAINGEASPSQAMSQEENPS